MGKYDGYSFIFDVDGTICPIKGHGEEYSALVPYISIVEKIRYYKREGARIVINTSRNMRTYDNNIGLINAHTAPLMMEWLKRWDIPFDEIIFGKPWPGEKGFYVDDRTVRPDEFLALGVEEMGELCRKGRLNGKN